MGKKLLATVLLFLTVAPLSIFAQSGSLSGKVTDGVTGESLPGANVYLLEVKRGASTDINGEYTITGVQAGEYTMVASFLGYIQVKEKVTIGASAVTKDIELSPDVVGLEDVVVTGIASKSSKAVAEVAISKVDASALTIDKSYQDVSQLMAGKVAGVNVQAASGTVGGGIRFNIRSGGGLNGSGQPIIFIDGVRIDNSQLTNVGAGGQGVGTLSDINPEDIESIDVLKGPAGAALYGTSGSNGVVLITTKKGKTVAGKGTVNVNYKGRVGYNEQSVDYPDSYILSADVANGIFVEGAINQHTVSVSGGTEFIRYFTSFDATSEEGIVPGNNLERQSFRANFDAFPSDKLTMSVNTGFTLNSVNLPQNDNNIYGWLGNVVLAQFGTPYLFTDSLDIVGVENETKTNRFIGSFQLNWRPLDGLTVNASIGYDGSNVRTDSWYPPGGAYGPGNRDLVTRQNAQFTYDLNASYNFKINDDITSNTLVGTQVFDRRLRTSSISRENFQSSLITTISAGQDITLAAEGFAHIREAGVFFQEEINYKDAVFLTVGGRQDYASSVGFEAPNIFYPKASVAVRLDQFGIPISFLKVRAAYGETGVLPGQLAGQRLLWQASASGFGTGASLNRIGNEEIAPERIKETEFGVEMSLGNSFGIDFTYYLQNAEDSIINFANAPSTGLIASSIPVNIGAVEGSGFELAVNATPFLSKNTQLDLNFILSYQTNEITDLGGAQPIRDGFDLNTYEPGLPRAAFYPVQNNGAIFDPATGAYAGVDLGNDTAEGRVFRGIPYPEYQGSFSFDFRFLKNFNLYTLVEAQMGLSLYDNTRWFASNFRNQPEYESLRAELGFNSYYNLFFAPGDAEYIEPLTVGSPEYIASANRYGQLNLGSDSGYISEADFMRIREVSLRYNFNDVLKSAGLSDVIKNAALAVSVRNLALFTNYDGIDPEVNFSGARSLTRGQDFLTLQQPRVYNATLSLGF